MLQPIVKALAARSTFRTPDERSLGAADAGPRGAHSGLLSASKLPG
jgi:hypothetical protein